uniref:Velvet domain-containing protein n=2 Tax=Kalmanozyma brasiliensis (strain GHG001) TaxID=1365824 RepID=V5EHP8_KALBG
MSKTDDSSSSQTPVGASEGSVAYQYVAVKQMTSARDHIEYQLTVREQPKQSRMCGVGEKADRRPIDPAPIVQLRVITHDRPIQQCNTVESGPVAPPVERRPGHGPKAPKAAGVRPGLPVATALGDGWEDKAWYLENPYLFMYAMLCNADTDEELHLLNDGKTRYTSGSCVSCLYHLKDIDGSHQGFFVFPDLSIRVEGRYRLKLCLFETIGHSVHHCKSIYSDPFHVYTAKRFPGMEESTRLSKSFAEQGLKVRVRKHPRSRRRGSKRTKEDSDASEDTPLARDRSPKRARASDILPVSGLPVPQPIAFSRLPHSYDARFERADYDREALMRPMPYDPHAPLPRSRAAWEQEQAMRARDPRSWDPRYDQEVYARPGREVDERQQLPHREFADARYMDEYSARSRAPAVHPGMSDTIPSDYPDQDRSAYPRNDDSARALHRPPPASTQGPPSSAYPPFPGRGGHLEAASQGRNYPSAPAPMPLPPARVHSRGYGPPDHAAHDPARAYDDHGAPPPPRRDPRYSAPYDARNRPPGRFSPSPPPPGSIDYNGRGHYPPPTQWRSGPSSPRLADYHSAPQRSPVPTSARGIAAPLPAFVGEPAGRGYPPAAYESGPPPGRSSRSPNPYTREGDSDRFGAGMRPVLPPLDRERDPAYGAQGERYLPSPSGYAGRGEVEADWERERAMRAGRPVREDEYRNREWEPRAPARPPSGGPPRGY